MKYFILSIFCMSCAAPVQIQQQPQVQPVKIETSTTCCARGASCEVVEEHTIGEACYCPNYNTYYLPYYGHFSNKCQ